MAVSYKDINQLSQKSSIAGTEKLPVSDTQYITPSQIAGMVIVPNITISTSTPTSSQGSNGDIWIVV